MVVVKFLCKHSFEKFYIVKFIFRINTLRVGDKAIAHLEIMHCSVMRYDYVQFLNSSVHQFY